MTLFSEALDGRMLLFLYYFDNNYRTIMAKIRFQYIKQYFMTYPSRNMFQLSKLKK